MAFTKNEEAVSPVIGVILMVAITVILAAVIAAFVFGMTGNVQKTKVVAAHATQSGNIITVVYDGGQDNAQVLFVRVRNYTQTGDIDQTKDIPNNNTVGSSVNFAGTGGQDKVIATAYFVDGSSQVIMDSTV